MGPKKWRPPLKVKIFMVNPLQWPELWIFPQEKDYFHLNINQRYIGNFIHLQRTYIKNFAKEASFSKGLCSSVIGIFSYVSYSVMGKGKYGTCIEFCWVILGSGDILFRESILPVFYETFFTAQLLPRYIIFLIRVQNVISGSTTLIIIVGFVT